MQVGPGGRTVNVSTPTLIYSDASWLTLGTGFAGNDVTTCGIQADGSLACCERPPAAPPLLLLQGAHACGWRPPGCPAAVLCAHRPCLLLPACLQGAAIPRA